MNSFDARNRANEILLSVQRALGSQTWQQLRDEEKSDIRGASERLASVRNDDDIEAIRNATVALDQVTLRFAELMMEAAVIDAIRGKR
jgi:hypothetical protein